MNIKMSADKVKVNGPKVDGGYTVSFEVGEYMQSEVARVVMIPPQTEIVLDITITD